MARVRFPQAIKAGDLIRVVSPAGPVDREQLQRGVDRLRQWDYSVEIAPSAMTREGYLAGSDKDRLNDLVSALTDPDVRGVFCSRGGYGSVRLLEFIPWDELSRVTPKVFVGFSDVSVIQLLLWYRCNYGTFSGPQVAMGLGGENISSRSIVHLRQMIEGSAYRLAWRDNEPLTLKPVRAGSANGVIVASCLSMLVCLLGTSFFPDLSGTILCIEDIGEPLYRIDRMLWQLDKAGVINDLHALVLGSFLYNGKTLDEEVGRIALDVFSKYSFPIWLGLPYGHVNDRLTIPVGADSSINEDGVITLLKP